MCSCSGGARESAEKCALGRKSGATGLKERGEFHVLHDKRTWWYMQCYVSIKYKAYYDDLLEALVPIAYLGYDIGVVVKKLLQERKANFAHEHLSLKIEKCLKCSSL